MPPDASRTTHHLSETIRCSAGDSNCLACPGIDSPRPVPENTAARNARIARSRCPRSRCGHRIQIQNAASPHTKTRSNRESRQGEASRWGNRPLPAGDDRPVLEPRRAMEAQQNSACWPCRQLYHQEFGTRAGVFRTLPKGQYARAKTQFSSEARPANRSLQVLFIHDGNSGRCLKVKEGLL